MSALLSQGWHLLLLIWDECIAAVRFLHLSVAAALHENSHLQLCLCTRPSTVCFSSFFFMFARLDFSMVDLLDILSPVSVPKQSKASARRPETSQHRSALKTPGPVSRTLLTPARSYLHHTLEDPEESQILEDIFFIC